MTLHRGIVLGRKDNIKRTRWFGTTVGTNKATNRLGKRRSPRLWQQEARLNNATVAITEK